MSRLKRSIALLAFACLLIVLLVQFVNNIAHQLHCMLQGCVLALQAELLALQAKRLIVQLTSASSCNFARQNFT